MKSSNFFANRLTLTAFSKILKKPESAFALTSRPAPIPKQPVKGTSLSETGIPVWTGLVAVETAVESAVLFPETDDTVEAASTDVDAYFVMTGKGIRIGVLKFRGACGGAQYLPLSADSLGGVMFTSLGASSDSVIKADASSSRLMPASTRSPSAETLRLSDGTTCASSEPVAFTKGETESLTAARSGQYLKG